MLINPFNIMALYFSSPMIQSIPQGLYGFGPSYTTINNFDRLQQALYEEEQFERQRRLAMDRELRLRRLRRQQLEQQRQRELEQAMERAVLESALCQWVENEVAQEQAERAALAQRQREAMMRLNQQRQAHINRVKLAAQKERESKKLEAARKHEQQSKCIDDGSVYIQLGNMIFRVGSTQNDARPEHEEPSKSDETGNSGEQEEDGAFDHLVSLTAETQEPADLEKPSAESTTEAAAEPAAEPAAEVVAEPSAERDESESVTPSAEPAKPELEPEAEVEAKVEVEAGAEAEAEAENEVEQSSSEPHLLFSYDFPSAATAYGRSVREQVNSNNITIEANELNEGSLKIKGLWSKRAPSRRARSPQSPRVSDVDENGEEIIVQDTRSREVDRVAFTESATIPMPSREELRTLRAELDDAGFKLWA